MVIFQSYVSLPEGINVPMQQDSMDSLLNETHHRRPKFDQRRFWGLFVLNKSQVVREYNVGHSLQPIPRKKKSKLSKPLSNSCFRYPKWKKGKRTGTWNTQEKLKLKNLHSELCETKKNKRWTGSPCPATGAMAWVPPSNRRKMGGGTIDTCPSEHWYHHHDRHGHHDRS